MPRTFIFLILITAACQPSKIQVEQCPEAAAHDEVVSAYAYAQVVRERGIVLVGCEADCAGSTVECVYRDARGGVSYARFFVSRK